MLQFGSLTLGKKPRIAASVTDRVLHYSLLQAKRSGLDLVEMRVDLFHSMLAQHLLKEAVRFSKNFPVLATIRSSKEGGRWSKSERPRLALYEALVPAVDGVDVELNSKTIVKEVVRAAKRNKKAAVLSYHDFQRTPSITELKNLLCRAKDMGADIVKIAVQAHSMQDVSLLAEFTSQNRNSGLITISMGEQGSISRVYFPLLGSLVTFAHLGHSSAPGQLDLKTTVSRIKAVKLPIHLPTVFV